MSPLRSLISMRRWLVAAVLVVVILGVGKLAYANAPDTGDAKSRETAKEVFASQDFWWKRTSQAETPSLLNRALTWIYETLLKPVLDWLLDILKRIAKVIIEWLMGGLRSVAGDWSGGIPFVRLFVIALVGFVVWRLVVMFLRRTPSTSIVTKPVVAERLATALELLAEAEAAARRGDEREAIRLAFLSVIAHFQDQGKLSGSRSRSNREYLRELYPWPDLSEIFRRCAEPFEQCWYGGRRLDGLEVDAVISECRRLATAGSA